MESETDTLSEGKNRGGTTCCVPLCRSNSVKNPELSFHKFSLELSLKQIWMNLLHIERSPLKSHKICSLHFPGGKKSFGALPTVLNTTCRKTINSSEGRKSILNHNITNTNETSSLNKKQQV